MSDDTKKVGRPTVITEAVEVDRQEIAGRLRAGLSRRLRSQMDQRGIGAPQLAQRIGASPEAVRLWLRGIHLPALDLIYAAAIVLDCSPSWLAFGG